MVVEEQLLELVEDQIEIATGVRCSVFQRIRKRTGAPSGRLDQGGNRISRPSREDDDLYALLLPEAVRDPRAQDGALPDSARPVQDRDAGRHQIGGDHLRLSFASKEQQRVEIGVLEGRETLVR